MEKKLRVQREKWRLSRPPYTVGKDEFAYKDVVRDEDGWCDPKVNYPLPFDMCELKTENKVRKGWWSGSSWESIRLKEDEPVLYWKKCKDE